MCAANAPVSAVFKRVALAALFVSVGILAACAKEAPAERSADASTPPLDGEVGGVWRLGDERVAALTSIRTIYVWDVHDLSRPIQTLKCPWYSAIDVSFVSASRAAWSDLSDQEGANFNIVDVETSKTVFKYPLRRWFCEAIARNEARNLVAWIEEGKVRGSAQTQGVDSFVLRMADCLSGELKLDIEIPKVARHKDTDSYESMGLAALAISPDGTTIAFGTRVSGQTMGVVDTTSKSVLWYREMAKGGPGEITYNMDSRTFLANTATGTCYDARSGEKVYALPPVTFPAVAMLEGVPMGHGTGTARLSAMDISPDGKYLAADTDGAVGVVIYDLAEKKELMRIKTSSWPIESALCFSADSKGIWAAGTLDRDLRFFRVFD